MKNIVRHKFNESLIYDEAKVELYKKAIDGSIHRIVEELNVNLFKGAGILKKLFLNDIMTNKKEGIVIIVEKFLDYGISHVQRVLFDGDVDILINTKKYTVRSVQDNYGAGFSNWFDFYVLGVLLNYNVRRRSISSLDIESCNPENRSYWWLAYKFFKAYESGNGRDVYTYRERAEAYANEGKTFFVGVEEGKNIKMRETPKLKYIWYPIIELFYLVYFNKEEEFNAYLGEYLASKKQWIIDNKEEDNSLFWIDFPSLAACAEAHRKGFNITVESDYIPAWVYRGEFT